MIFIKHQNPPQTTSKSYDTFWQEKAYVVPQDLYQLPDTESKVWYENRDLLHSNAQNFENTIQLTTSQTSYAINVMEAYGNGIVISNSSTATTASEDRGSNTRTPDRNLGWWHSIREAWQMGLIQFFPEHQDYDVIDWFKLNQPYVITTQGSSGSELGEVDRCRQIVLALRPEVRDWLIANKRVGDVVSYLMRANQSGYLDPMCHRVVVNGRDANQSDLDLSTSITLDTIPPRLKIKVISDSLAVGTVQQLRDSSTIRTDEVAGFRRSTTASIRTIVVELESDKPCEFHWIKTQGESTITYQNPERSRATITIPLQGNFDVIKPDGSTLESNRVEVIAVAYDGTHYSSPVFVTEYFPPETRQSRSRMNEILVHADDAFSLKVNGTEVLIGNSWSVPYRKEVVWAETNIIEAEVANTGGPGGFLCAMWVADELHVADSTWQVSLDKQSWVAPVLIGHGGSVWAHGVSLPNDVSQKGAAWLWHPQATERSTVYFRKTIGSVVPVPTPEPEPEPTPQPNVIAECISDLEAVLSKLRGIA